MLSGSLVLTQERATSCLPHWAFLAVPEPPHGPRAQPAPTQVRFPGQAGHWRLQRLKQQSCVESFLVRPPFSLVLREKEIKYPVHYHELSPATFKAMTLGVPSGTEI